MKNARKGEVVLIAIGCLLVAMVAALELFNAETSPPSNYQVSDKNITGVSQ